MAFRKIYIVDEQGCIKDDIIKFEYFSGFSVMQKKSMFSLKKAITKKYKEKCLEISSKSVDYLGKMMSAFNLCVIYNNRKVSIENIFQSSKVFKNGGPYIDLLSVPASNAKKDYRLRSSGELIKFTFNGKDYPTKPLTLFYNYIYCKALLNNLSNIEILNQYSIFCDIEFNYTKSINNQAYATAIFISLYRRKVLHLAFKSIVDFKKYAYENSCS